MTPLLAIGLSSLASVPVVGDTRCPTAAEAQRALDATAPAGARPSASARLASDGAGLTVTLSDAETQQSTVRRLPAGPSCDELAQAVAVIVAAWEAELPSVRAQPELPSEPPLLRGRAEAPALAPSEPWSFEFAAGGGASASGDVAPVGLASAAVGRGGRWSAVTSFLGSGLRSAPLGPGAVSWRRWEWGLGARLRLTRSPELSLQAEAVGAALTLAGHGFTDDATAVELEPGVRWTLRVAWAWGAGRVWLALAASAWPLQQQADVGGLSTSAAIPQVEGLGLLGVAYAVP